MTSTTIPWPPKHDLFGVGISSTHYTEVVQCIIDAAQRRQPGVVSCHAVHAVVTASCDPDLLEKVNQFDVITPDGQPVRWALNLLYRTRMQDRVYGPELMLRLCEAAAAEGVSIYLYGGSPKVITKLRERLLADFPGLGIAGCDAPPFRPLTTIEDARTVEKINGSGAGIVLIGLGCPKQDLFAFEHRDRLQAVQVCVGAAFDFHGGAKSMAPLWMQNLGLEWLFRLIQEPRRLWRRYLVTNTIFVVKLTAQASRAALRRVVGQRDFGVLCRRK